MGKSILPTLSTWWQWQGHFSDSVSNTSLGSVTTSMPASRTFTYPSSSMTVSGAAVTTAAAGSGSTAAGAGRQSCYWLICTFCDEQIDRWKIPSKIFHENMIYYLLCLSWTAEQVRRLEKYFRFFIENIKRRVTRFWIRNIIFLDVNY